MGIFVLVWGFFVDKSKNTVFWGGVLIVLAIAGFSDNKYKNHIDNKSREKQLDLEKQNKEKEKQKVIALYNNLEYGELEMLDECLDKNSNIYDGSFRIDLNNDALRLEVKGFGIIKNPMFVFKSEYLEWIRKYKEEQEQLKKDKRKRKKQEAKSAD